MSSITGNSAGDYLLLMVQQFSVEHHRSKKTDIIAGKRFFCTVKFYLGSFKACKRFTPTALIQIFTQ